jgi:hypothetical protein
MRAASLAILLCLPAGVPGAEPPINLTPGAKARPGLYEEILAADEQFFRRSSTPATLQPCAAS